MNRRYEVGDDPNRWWICKVGSGRWYVHRPCNIGGPTVHRFNTGAEAFAAFARGPVGVVGSTE